MSIRGWPSVTLKGNTQIIPTVCPLCLGPGDVKMRYYYQGGWLSWSSDTKYYQSFFYCPTCADGVQEYLNRRARKSDWWGLIIFFLLLAGLVALTIGMIQTNYPGDYWLNIGFSAFFLLGTLFFLTRLLRSPRTGVQRQEPGAYYTGGGWLDLSDRAVYRARRPEWIRALVQANPEQVDDATYIRIVGAPRPEPPPAAPEGRPFAG